MKYRKILALTTLIFNGCVSYYDRDFHCPAPGNGSCRPLDQTYELMLKRNLETDEFHLEEYEL